MRLWDVASGQTLRTFRGHTYRVLGCAFSPDGRLALSASTDYTLRLWDVERGAEIARWLTDAGLPCCAFCADGHHVMAGDMIGGVHFLEVMGAARSDTPG